MFRVRYRRRGSFAADRGDKQKEAPPAFGVSLTKKLRRDEWRSFRQNGTERFFEARSNF
jgi:hypothetical protein